MTIVKFTKKLIVIFTIAITSINAAESERQTAVPEENQSEVDVDDGINPADKSILKRSKAIVESAEANSQRNRKGRNTETDNTSVCGIRLNNICISSNGSVIVLPGSTVNGDIINIPSRK